MTNSIGMEMIRIPAGVFEMGSASGNSNESPVHTVTLTQDFWMGMYEVTQAEYEAVSGNNPSSFSGDSRLPVESVSWLDAITFANALSTSEGLSPCYDGSGDVIGGDIYACTGYRLPTEAEWEYAARAGTTTDYSFGDDASQLGNYAWFSSNSDSKTHIVGAKLPNPWGLYDVHGNVWELVHDWSGYYSQSPNTNPPGPSTGSYRVYRGGSWNSVSANVRSADRNWNFPSQRYSDVGFRLAKAAAFTSSPPDAPFNPSPADGATEVSISTTLSWSGSDPDGDALGYEVKFGTTNPPPGVLSTSSTSYNPGTLSAGTTYYWQVVASDGQSSTPSPVWSFTTASSGGGGGAPFGTMTNSIGMEMIRIPAGTFEMGSMSGLSDESPVHTVMLTQDFWMGMYEVTQAEYEAVTGNNPSSFRNDGRLPVESVSWLDVIAFANALSTSEGLSPCYDGSGEGIGGDIYACTGYRLPTEAEWEYAARAGTATEYSFGDDASQLGNYAWFSANSGSKTHIVGAKLPNSWGLYDMYGNVWELVHDYYSSGYYFQSPNVNPPGPTTGSIRVDRGGSFLNDSNRLRSAARSSSHPSSRYGSLGFRLARAATFTSSPPDAPFNPSPADGTTELSTSTTLSWSGSDPDGDALGYEVKFGTTNPPPGVLSTSSTSYNPGTLSAGTTYYWQVVASDGQSSTSGPVWSFTTASSGGGGGTPFGTMTNSIGMEMIRIPAGTFEMGSTSGASDELPVHTVTLTQDFWMGMYEVTQAEYEAVTGQSPSGFSGDSRLPVEQVRWFDAIAFANALSTSEGLSPCYDGSGGVIGSDVYACTGYRLPTEAEWEYAARAGTTTEYSFGDDASQLGNYAWYNSNSNQRTHVVGAKVPNPWGLYDMHGNIWEWVHDWYDIGYYSQSPNVNPPGPDTGFSRVARGGGWDFNPFILRSARRGGDLPSVRTFQNGFRLARAAR